MHLRQTDDFPELSVHFEASWRGFSRVFRAYRGFLGLGFIGFRV